EVVGLAPAPDWLLEWLRQGKGTGKRTRADEGTNLTNQLPSAPASPSNREINSFGRPPAPGSGKVLFAVRPAVGPDVRSRAIAYLQKCPPAVSGQGGHDQTFEVARSIVYGFDLGPEVGFDLLQQHYNPRCVPPWSEAELRHKCHDADTRPYD